MIGGLSWHSTALYYQAINSTVEARLGNYRSAPLLISSLDFGPIVEWQLKKQWERAGEALAAAASSLQKAGAEAIMICSNTMHKVAPQVEAQIDVPLLHIATAIAQELRSRGEQRATLLGTRYTMSDSFLKEALAREGIEAAQPAREQAKAINQAIFKRLVFGRVEARDQELLLEIARNSVSQNRGPVVLGCTELGLLVTEDLAASLFVDSAEAHARMGSEFLLF